MKRPSFLNVGLAVSVALAPQASAANDLGAGIAGLMIGAMIAGAAQNNAPPAQRHTPRKAAPSRPAAEIQADKDMQQALNNFGFDAGPVDGAPGKRTRAAIATFQGTLGRMQDGVITADQRVILQDAMARERLNPAEAAQLAAANPYGRRGLPAMYQRTPMAPAAPYPTPMPPYPQAPAAPYPQPPATPYAQPQMPAAPVPVPPAAAPALAAPAAAPPAPAITAQDSIPDFGDLSPPAASMNNLCNQTSVLTNSNGGMATAEQMPNPGLALDEQFCLARTFATADGEKVAKDVGATQALITSLCGQMKTALSVKLADPASRPPEATLAEIRKVIDASGKTLSATQVSGRVCLAEGYRTDDAVMANVALATLAAADMKPYAELLGHHLREGFGFTANPEASRTWIRFALSALSGGAAPAVLPNQTAERTAILSKAITAN
ncbi:peptidoglycan-binding protein [Rhodobacter capsulatus]|uniref:Peptidoglycan-binding protein n=1 Tax=Rhodobacter capsulatus TaxID=1061 RepID=A0A4U1JMZ4_RHOCA|nr:peptidoglycan-binding domain-containing protein [Rhodobacter capsulatus]TKD15804.1 peptidoglycan-binding protein [Rhodobacter capsulatus]